MLCDDAVTVFRRIINTHLVPFADIGILIVIGVIFVLSLCSRCALVVLSLCSRCALVVLSLCSCRSLVVVCIAFVMTALW